MRSNFESLVRKRQEEKEQLRKRVFSNLLKTALKDKKLYCRREAAKHFKILYLLWAEHKLFSSLPSLLLTSDIEFSKYSLVIIDGTFFIHAQDKRLSGTV